MTGRRRAPNARIDRERILAAALGIVDVEGLARLTMRRLGEALGVEAMTVYGHFASRTMLIDALVESVVLRTASDPAVVLAPDDDWADYLYRLAHGVRQMALAHPRLFPLIATHPTEAPWLRPPLRSLPWVESFLVGLQEHHFPPPAAVTAYKQFSTFLLGTLLLEVGSLGLDHPRDAAAPGRADPDRQAAGRELETDARAAEAATVGGPDAEQIQDAASSRVTDTAQEPTVLAAAPEVAAATENDRTVAAVVQDADIPVAAVLVSTASVDLSAYPQVQSLAGLLAADTARADFDRQLSALMIDLADLRRP